MEAWLRIIALMEFVAPVGKFCFLFISLSKDSTLIFQTLRRWGFFQQLAHKTNKSANFGIKITKYAQKFLNSTLPLPPLCSSLPALPISI